MCVAFVFGFLINATIRYRIDFGPDAQGLWVRRYGGGVLFGVKPCQPLGSKDKIEMRCF